MAKLTAYSTWNFGLHKRVVPGKGPRPLWEFCPFPAKSGSKACASSRSLPLLPFKSLARTEWGIVTKGVPILGALIYAPAGVSAGKVLWQQRRRLGKTVPSYDAPHPRIYESTSVALTSRSLVPIRRARSTSRRKPRVLRAPSSSRKIGGPPRKR